MGGFGTFAFVSHKLLRWVLPLVLCVFLITNAALIRHPTYAVFGLLQLSFYLCAALGYLFRERTRGVQLVLIPFFLLAMNFAFLVGLFRCLTKQEEVIWQRVS
jgi:hypothetical protein